MSAGITQTDFHLNRAAELLEPESGRYSEDRTRRATAHALLAIASAIKDGDR